MSTYPLPVQELIERINQHPDDFLRLMNEPPDAEGQAMMEMGYVHTGCGAQE